MELQRLTTVFDADESKLTQGFKSVDEGFNRAEKRAQDSVSRFDRISASIGSAIGKGITVALGDVGAAVDSLTNITSGALKSIPVVGTGLAAAFDEAQGAMKSAIETGFAFDDQMKRNRVSLGLVAGGANDAVKELKGLRGISSSSEFGLSAIVASARELQIMQGNARDVVPEIRAIGNAAAALDEGEAGLLSIANAFARISEMGKVASRDARVLIRQGIPVFDILAEASGMSKTRAKRLLDSGRIAANDFIDILLGDFQKRYPDAARQMAETIAVQNAKLSSGMAALKGAAFQNLHDTTVAGLQDINKLIRGPQAGQIAAGVNAAASPVTGLINSSLKALESGDLFGGALRAGESAVEGLKKGITSKAGEAYATVKGWAQGVVSAFEGPDGIDAHSPSRKFEALGVFAAEGFGKGFGEGMDEAMRGVTTRVGAMLDEAYGALDASRGRRALSTRDIQERNKANLDRLAQREPDFLPTLKREAEKRGMNPDDILNLISIESQFNKSVTNKFGYSGLGQIGRNERASLGLPRGDAAAKQVFDSHSAAWQLVNALFPLIDAKNRESIRRGAGPLDDLSKLYAAWGAGHAERDPNAVMAVRGGMRSSMYANNPLWDFNKDGVIRQSEFGQSARASLGAGINFTINGGAISASNPMPVSLVAAPSPVTITSGGDLQGGTGQFANPDAPITVTAQAEGEIKDFGDSVVGMTSVVMKALQPLPVEFGVIGDSADNSGKQIEDAYTRAASKLKGVRGELLELGITQRDIGDSFEKNFSDAFDHIGEEGHNFARDLGIGILQDIRHTVGQGIAGELRDAFSARRMGARAV